ncbi:MAG: protein kinase domain-containing protein, partial [Gemmataceae bacterium]
MASPVTVADFLSLLHRSGLLGPDAPAPDSATLPADPAAAAKALIGRGLITPYHAQHLLAGRCKGFFLGAYRLLGKLGQGGMGAVYLAEHTALKRRVALKVFPPERATDPTAVARFQREGRAAAALDHPNIVRVHDIAQAGSVHFLVLEYAEGVTLDRVMKDKGP